MWQYVQESGIYYLIRSVLISILKYLMSKLIEHPSQTAYYARNIIKKRQQRNEQKTVYLKKYKLKLFVTWMAQRH